MTLVGRSRYLADLRQPGQLDVAFVRSPHAHARIRRIDVARAAAMPGVVAVMAGDEAARMCRPWRGILAHYTGMKAGAQLPLAVGKVRFVGEPVAAVVAANRYLAEDACDAVQVEYDPLPAVTEAADALKAGAPILHEDQGDNLVYHKDGTAGDAAGAFAAADRVIRAVADLGVNVQLISAGASMVAYHFTVDTKDLEKAVQAVHREFFGQRVAVPDHPASAS